MADIREAPTTVEYSRSFDYYELIKQLDVTAHLSSGKALIQLMNRKVVKIEKAASISLFSSMHWVFIYL